LLTGASCEGPKGLECKSPHSFKGVGRCQSGIHHRNWSDPFGQVCQTVTSLVVGGQVLSYEAALALEDQLS